MAVLKYTITQINFSGQYINYSFVRVIVLYQNGYLWCCWCLDHVIKKAKYDKTEEYCHQKQADKRQKNKRKKKKKSIISSAENVTVSSVKQQTSSSVIPRLPRFPAEISANWKQLIEVKVLSVYYLWLE